MLRLRSYFSSIFRRIANYLSTTTNIDLISLPAQTFNYLQNYYGNNLKYVLYFSFLLLLFLFALINDSNDVYMNDVHRQFQYHDKEILTNQNNTIQNIDNNLLSNIINTTNNGTSSNNKQYLIEQQYSSGNEGLISLSSPFWFSMIISIIMWMIFIQVLKYIRQRTISMFNVRNNNRNHDADNVRMLAQLMSISNRFPNGLSNRLRIALLNRDFTADDYEMLQILDDNDNSSNPRGAEENMINRLPVHTITTNDISLYNHTNEINDNHDNQTTLLMNQYDNSNNNDTNILNESRRCNNICNICLEPYILNDEVRTILCLHKFHKNCIDQWLRINATCPICKHTATE